MVVILHSAFLVVTIKVFILHSAFLVVPIKYYIRLGLIKRKKKLHTHCFKLGLGTGLKIASSNLCFGGPVNGLGGTLPKLPSPKCV